MCFCGCARAIFFADFTKLSRKKLRKNVSQALLAGFGKIFIPCVINYIVMQDLTSECD